MKRKTTENVKSTQLIVVLCRRFSRVQHPQEHEKKIVNKFEFFTTSKKAKVCVCVRAPFDGQMNDDDGNGMNFSLLCLSISFTLTLCTHYKSRYCHWNQRTMWK